MKYFALAIGLLTLSCVDTAEQVNQVEYFKDSRTGLCFAAHHPGTQTGLLTNVPCTPEVEQLIQGGGQ